MTRGRAAAWVAFGFALGGVAAGWNLRRVRAEPSALATPVTEAGPRAGACPEPPELTARARRVEQLAKEADELFLANSQAHFRAPKDLPARFGGGAIERAVHESIVAAGVEAEILGTDCSEYPCLTTARTRSPADMKKVKDHFFAHPSYAGDMKQLTRTKGEGPNEFRFGAMSYPATDPRQGEIHAALTRRLGVARLGPGSRYPEASPFAPDTISGDTGRH